MPGPGGITNPTNTAPPQRETPHTHRFPVPLEACFPHSSRRDPGVTQPTNVPHRVSGRMTGPGGRRASALSHQMTEAPGVHPGSLMHRLPEGTLAS